MTQQVLEFRTRDNRLVDIDCSAFLDPSETLSSIISIDDDENVLSYGTPIVNTAPITYADGNVVGIGKVTQVRITGATIDVGQTSKLFTLRLLAVTSKDPEVDMTFQIRAIDKPT